jgi:hypothetical protein
MSTSSVTPDASSLTSSVTGPTPSNYVDQSSQNPPSALAAAVSQPPQDGIMRSRLNTVLNAVSNASNSQIAPSDQPPPAQSQSAMGPNAPSGSQRPAWKSTLGKVAGVVSTGLSGIPAGGRPSFAGGLGQGARAEQQAQATEQAIKFQSFQDQVRAANLHAQDLQKQAADDAQQKAQQAGEDFQNEALGNNGGKMETHPNDGTAVMQTLQAQTAANGTASITPGTHISADGKNINVPSNTPETLAAQVQNYKALEGKLPGLPGLPSFDPSSVKSQSDVTNARAALGQHLDIMQHLVQGYDQSGRPYTHQELNDLIPAYQSQIDSLSKNGGASDYQLGTLKNTLAILQANEQHHSDKEQEVNDQATANAVDKAKQLGDIKTSNTEQVDDNKAGNRPIKSIDTTELNAVAYDPNYQNPDGSKGGNVVMSKADAAAKGLTHYKADPVKVNSLVAGVNDVQQKFNKMNDAVGQMGQVDSNVVANLTGDFKAHAFGSELNMNGINAWLHKNGLEGANAATRDFVTAYVGAQEAISQLPRLQTMGQSSRVTETQMEQARKMLPQVGDDADMASRRMTGLQDIIDPIRRQVPHMPGAELMSSFREKGYTPSSRQAAPQQQAAPSKVGSFNPQTQAIDYANQP